MIAVGAKAALAAGYLLAGSLSCPAASPPRVTAHFTNNPPVYSTSLSMQQLSALKIDTKFSHGANEVFVTSGVTEGNIEAQFKMEFQRRENAATDEMCLWVTDIAIEIGYKPVVYIAGEHPANSCRYNTTALHELKHVNTDVITLKEYLPHIEQYMQKTAAALPAAGPLPLSSVEAAKEEGMKKISTALSTVVDYMQVTRHRRQQAIDTRQEYLRLSKACPQ